MEEASIVRGCQTLKEGSHLRRQAVIDLVARGPERVSAGFGQSVNLEHGVVGGYALKADIGVPSYRGEATRIAELVGKTTSFLLLFAADDADLVTKFAAFFRQRVNVEAR